MTSRIKQSLTDMRKSLEKLLLEDNEEEQIFDELTVLASIPVTADLIKESKLGKQISLIKDKYDTKSTKVANKAKEILVAWKKIMEHHKSTPDETKHHVVDNVAKFNSKTDASTVAHPDMRGYMSLLAPTRKSIVGVFTNIFKASVNPAMAEGVAVGIEEALNVAFPSDISTTAKQYSVRAKLLSFNIKKNDILRENIINQHIAYKDLVHMTAAELASQEQKVAREKMHLENVDERRLDWLAEHKEELQLDIGIDPGNTWDFDNGDDAMSEPDTDPPDI